MTDYESYKNMLDTAHIEYEDSLDGTWNVITVSNESAGFSLYFDIYTGTLVDKHLYSNVYSD